MRVALVSPPSEERKYEHASLSIPKMGLGYLAAVLDENNIDFSVIDAKFEHLGMEEVAGKLKKGVFDIVGITAMTAGIHSAGLVAKEAKRVLPNCTVVIGGAHAISLPKRTMDEFEHFDILVTGEGERTLVELTRAIEKNTPLEDVKGIIFRRNGETIFNPEREWIKDLDSLPFPAWHKYARRSSSYFVLASRGCPHNCAFCKRILGKKVRRRSAENVVAEIEWLHDSLKVKSFEFLDETFTLNRKRADQLLDMLIERGIGKKMRWNAQTRVDRVDEELFIKMKKAGCRQIEFGVESGNQETLDSIDKGIRLEQVETAVRLAKKASLKVGCSFIVGNPFETKEKVQETIDFLVKLNPDIISAGVMIPLPGTKIERMALNGEGNYRFKATSWKEFIRFGGGGLELDGLSRSEMEKLQIRLYLSFYLKNRRFFGLASYALGHRWQVLAAAKKMFSRKKSEST